MQSITFCKEINDPEEKKRREKVQTRIETKQVDYQRYGFTSEQIHAFAIFFDLAQEFNSLEDLYTLSVYLPKILFGMGSNLYILNQENQFCLQSSSVTDEIPPPIWQEPEPFSFSPRQQGNRFLIPVRCNHLASSHLPFIPKNGDVIGLFELITPLPLKDHERFFFEKYANRVGFQTHNRILHLANEEHLHFIKNLVQDIGHNVIVPNMYFKLLFNTLYMKLVELKEKTAELFRKVEKDTPRSCRTNLAPALSSLKRTGTELMNQYENMYDHYTRTSLFLETLLRRSHFEKGRYVLFKQACNFKKKIIDPQVNHFLSRFQEKNIFIDTQLGGIPDENIILVADIGLLSQVFANLFSNATKYTREVRDSRGTPRKFMSYGWERLPDYFGPGKHAIKPNVFTTGPHIPPEERKHLFESSFRCKATKNEPGSGHGLFFIKQIIELHGGEVGYEPTQMGNNFYVILPCVEESDPQKPA